MHRYIRHLFLVAAIGASTSAVGAELETFSAASNVTFGYADAIDGTMQREFEITPALDINMSARSSLVLSTRIRIDKNGRLEPGVSSYSSYSGASRPAALGNVGSAELRDVYFESRFEKGLVRFGKQQIVWGRLDGIKVLDLVNPQDFREFILEDFGESRIGLWSAYLDYSLGDWRAEIAVVPDATGHAIPERGAWFELTAPRFRFGASPGQIVPPVNTEKPGMTFDGAGFGLRLSRQIAAIDFSAVAYSGRDHEPLGRIVSSGGATTVERYYERRDAFGLSFDVGMGRTVLRGEYAYQPNRVFNTRSSTQLTTRALDQHRAAVGLDVDGPLSLFINIQYLLDTVEDAPAGLTRPAMDRIVTLYLRRMFAYDTLAFEARYYHSFTDDDELTSVGLSYAFSDSTSIRLGADYFSGSPSGLFGQFADRDRITIGLTHTF